MRFLETLLIINNNIINLYYHQQRVNRTLKYFNFKSININFKPKCLNCRVRITYSERGIEKIEYFKLTTREFRTFKIKSINCNYKFKYKNRACFNNLKTDNTELILIKNNLITDTTISNIAFYDGHRWITPKYPLLKGTKREELIEKKFLKEENIHKYDLKYFKKIALINAILGFFEIEEFDIIK